MKTAKLHHLSSKRSRLGTTAIALCLLSLAIVAQDIGHLGIESDPTPLVQARKASKRRNPSSSSTVSRSIGANLPDAGATGSVIATGPTAPRTGLPARSYEELMATAEAASRQGQYEPALDTYRRALASRPDSADAKLGIAETLLDAKKYKEAEPEFRQLIAAKPSLLEAQRGLADTLYELKRYGDAVSSYQTAAQAGLNDAELCNNFANALFRTGTVENKKRAIEYYRKAIQLQPEWPGAYAGLANALRSQRGAEGPQLAEALTSAKKSVELGPNLSLGHSVLGRVYADMKDFTGANAEGQRAIQLAPNDPFTYLNLGGIFHAEGKFQEAEQAYLKAISLDPQWAFPYHSLGTLYLTSLNRLQDASVQFSKATLLEPNSPTLWTSFGAARARAGDYNTAANHFKKAIEIDPKYIAAYHNLGAVYAINRNYADAATAFKTATELDPTRPDYFTALGDVYRKMGREKEAQEAFQRASALGGKSQEPAKESSGDKSKKDDKKKKKN
jgi:superkiller protein 3